MKRTIRIGTRGSRLALVQTGLVADALRMAHPALNVEVVRIVTSGDWKPAQGETRLSEAAGGKGQFAREIELALLKGEIDCGVHSMKDMPSFLPDELVIDHMLPREDARDAFLANECSTLAGLEQGASLGTSSLRRQAFILARRPDLRILPLRGNVPTRIEKLRAGQVDATFLALAGLRRLGLEHEVACVLEPEEMLPSAGQGAIGIEVRKDNKWIHEALDVVHCKATGLCVTAERAALQILNGSCHTPIGSYAVLDGNHLTLQAAVASTDGKQFYEAALSGRVETSHDAQILGEAVGKDLKAHVPPGLLL